MSVLLHGVEDPKTQGLFGNEDLKNHLLSMEEYVRIAERLIGCNASPSASLHMLNDEDAISFVANKLMIGTCKWVAGGKRGSHRGYLGQCGVWAIQTWTRQKSKVLQKEWDNISLHHELIHNAARGSRDVLLYQTLIDKRYPDPSESLDTTLSEQVQQAIDNACLDDQQRDIIDMVYVQKLTLEQVGDIFGVTKQRVDQLLKRIHQEILEADKNHGVLSEYYVGDL